MFHYTFLHFFYIFFTHSISAMVARQKIQHLRSAAGNESGTSLARQNSTLCTKHAKCIILVFSGLTFRISRPLYGPQKFILRPEVKNTILRTTLPHELKAKVSNTRYGLANFTAVEPILFFTTPGPKMPHLRSWAVIGSGTFGEDMVTKFYFTTRLNKNYYSRL